MHLPLHLLVVFSFAALLPRLQAQSTFCTDRDVRLRNGTTQREGRVEVCKEGVWGTICDDLWDQANARVVCRQLNFSADGARPVGGGFFAPGVGSIHMDNVECSGNEEKLLDCFSVEQHNCRHSEDAGVICEAPGFSCADGDLRLAGGDSDTEGRVEYCLDNSYGTVCDDGSWNDADANVVCNQLGYPSTENVSVISVPGGSFGPGAGAITLRGLMCLGSEETLINCSISTTFLSRFCRLSWAAGVLCPPLAPNCTNGQVRLVNGRIPGEGRVEVCYNNHWGTVCHDGWGDEDAQVVCRSLGYNPEGAIPIIFADFGAGDGLIFMTDVNCTGNESSLAECPRSDLAQTFCFHTDDSGVVCRDENNTCEEGAVRLVNGRTPNEGRLEICFSDHWGTVCDDGFDTSDANVVCRQLGLPPGDGIVFPLSLFGEGRGVIFLDEVNCAGNESRLADCDMPGEVAQSDCLHLEDVSVLCPSNDTTRVCENGDVQLVGGRGNYSGRVEVCFNNAWGTVCDDLWDSEDAAVVCKQLGFSSEGSVALSGAFFGEGIGPIFFDNANCNPVNHSSIIQCFTNSDLPPDIIGEHNCRHNEDASVICNSNCTDCQCTNGDIRLAGSNSSTEGRVEICVQGIWGTICRNFWDRNDASVTCKQLGFSPTDALPILNNQYGPGEGPIFADTFLCTGAEDRLIDCFHSRSENATCSHFQDVGVQCTSNQPCMNGALRLVGGIYGAADGRLEVCDGGQRYGAVCDNGFTSIDATVVCRQLGFSNGEGAIAVRDNFFGVGPRVVINNVDCTGQERNLTDCNFDTNTFFCFTDASIICRPNNATCVDGAVRLQGSSSPNEGTVEVCFNGYWGSVCSFGWSHIDTRTVCSILGFNSSKYALSAAGGYFPPSSGPVFLQGVNCTGEQQSITECLTDPPGDTTCSHFQDIGVICPVVVSNQTCENGAVRLADGPNRFEGRVEMCINGVWGTVCDDFWGQQDAQVVCNQLGFGTRNVTAVTDSTVFGPGQGPIYLDNVQCTGSEAHILDCASIGIGGNCQHSEDAGVICGAPPCTEGNITLVGGGDLPGEGTIQICVGGVWGTICDTLWGSSDAAVVCKQLGFRSEGALGVRGAHFGQGIGPIFMSGVGCVGNESSIQQCTSRPPFFCSHFSDAGVICPLPDDETANCTSGEIRLASSTSVYSGRVELCIHGRWGTVCDDLWDNRDAAVVCRQLGFNASGIPYGVGGAEFGPGNGLIFLDNVGCVGNESSLLDCRAPNISDHNCLSSEDASVYCPDPTASCSNGDIRLAGGDSPMEGRVEVCLGGVWGTVCQDFFWDDRAAEVVCRQLDLATEHAFSVNAAQFGSPPVPVHLSGLNCNGSEANLISCPTFRSFFIFPFFCQDHDNDVGVSCATPNETCIDGDIQLREGATPNEGRVEICYGNHWGTVCDDSWDNNDAAVVCRQAGYNHEGALAIPRGFFGSGFGRIHLDDLACEGDEDALINCTHSGVRNHNCAHSEDAGVICIVDNPPCVHGALRLIPGSDPDEEQLRGTLEICFGGNWGTICDDFWGVIDAGVACRQLGFYDEGAIAVPRARYGQGSGPIFLDNVGCRGNETRVADCSSDGIAVHNCFHGEDAGVICLPVPCKDGEMRVRSGYSSLNGRLEVCINQVWTTVCSNGFTDDIAAAACSAITNSTASGAFQSAEGLFRESPSNRPISVVTLCDRNSNCTFNVTAAPSSCTHENDIGVFCPEEGTVCTTGEMKLGGNTPDSQDGRLEICLNNEWGTVCDDSWDERGVNLVCSKLFGESSANGEMVSALDYPNVENFPILLDDVKCRGTESNILSCPQLPLNTTHDCTHREDVALSCNGTTSITCTHGDVRLINSDIASEGTVQICLNDVWGTVCDDLWDQADSDVVCRYLGFPEGNSIALRGAHFGVGPGPINLDNVQCTGSETSLLDCTSSLQHNCGHFEDAGVVCPSNDDPGDCSNGEVRLVNGDSNAEGRVEVCLHGRWGTVCDDLWDNRDAAVVCRQLGFNSTDGFPYYVNRAGFGQGTGLIFMDNVECDGTEESLFDCRSNDIGDHNCGHSEDSGVYCPDPSANCTTGGLRLVGGTTEYEGRVEVCVGGEWGTICADSYWGDLDATVVCNQLGLPSQFAVGVGGSSFGPGTGSVLFQIVDCTGEESGLLQCPYSFINRFNTRCISHSSDASVICHDPNFMCNETEIRLRGGATPNEGRVEICLSNHWGTLCDNDWDNRDAQVVCRQLKYRSEGAIAARAGRFGAGFGRVHLDMLNCSGSEEELFDCGFMAVQNATCSSFDSDVGVVCPVGEPVCIHGKLRLQEGRTPLDGRVEICIGGRWGTVCDDLFDSRDASVACRQLDYSGQNARAIFSVPGAATNVPIFLDNMRCSGTERSLLDCPANPVSSHNCVHVEDVGVICQPLPCIDGTVRLANGYNSRNGRVEVCVNEAWATVCGTGFTDEYAGAVCAAIGAPTEGAFRSGDGLFYDPSLTTPIYTITPCGAVGTNCTFNITAAPSSCTHENDVGVFCPEEAPTICNTGRLRLTGGDLNSRSGRVEVCINNQWGTICDDSWDDHSTTLVCSTLHGVGQTGEMRLASDFGGGSGVPILLDDVKCRGRESNILSCPQLPLNTTHDCTHREDVALSCNGRTTCKDGDIRLINGVYISEGTVQICLNDVWGTVCDDLWGQSDSDVVCRYLNFTEGTSLAPQQAYFGPGTGPIHLDNVQCNGDETSLLECRYSPHNCDHFEDAGVICPLPPGIPVNCSNGDVRLANGNNKYQGRVEVCYHGNWGTVCDDSWDRNDAAVVCRQLGFNGGFPHSVSSAVFGPGTGVILMDDVNCDGTEDNIFECDSSNPGTHNCNHFEDAGVYCPDPTSNCTSGEVRLVGGLTEYEGRLEVCIGGTWGTVCADFFWDDVDASVVCGQLGHSSDYAVGVGRSAFGPGDGPILFQSVRCNGSEPDLLSCPHSTNIFACFSHSSDASVVCQDPNFRCNETEIRLSGGATPNEGRVEICLDNHWGTLCDNDWDNTDAQVVCRQLGYRTEGAIASPANTFGEGFGRVHLDQLNCTGSELKLHDCQHVSEQLTCNRFETDVGVICPVDEPVCTHGNLRLQEGRTPLQGRVEICIGGRWGTVCDDLFDSRDAAVMCSHLGFSRQGAVASFSFPGAASEVPILLDNLRCIGNETSLLDCRASPIAAHNCIHNEDAGVFCQPRTCANGDIRIRDGVTASSGRVEVCITEIWGTVCDLGIDQSIAADICVKANFSGEGVIIATPGYFAGGSGPVYTSQALQGTVSLAPGCSHQNDMSVFCPEEQFSVCKTGQIRLAGGSQTEGRLEICIGDRWGTVCDDAWHPAASAVACNVLGMYGGELIGASQFGDAKSLPIFMDDVKCDGTETNLLSCPQEPMEMDGDCTHSEDVGLRCLETAECDEEGKVRLVGGPDSTRGRVEMCKWGQWTSLCADASWNNVTAQAVCRELGYTGGVPVGKSFYGKGSGSAILSQKTTCPDATAGLDDCTNVISVQFCSSHKNDAGVACIDPGMTCNNGRVRLMEGANQFSGAVEQCSGNQWMGVCGDQWGSDEAAVVCRQLSLRTDNAMATPEGFYGNGAVMPTTSSYTCGKGITRLEACNSVQQDSCNSSVAGVICQAQSTECKTGALRLVDGTKNSGRLQICMGGSWGSVCDSQGVWGINETKLVCSNLGYKSNGVQSGSAFYAGQNSGLVFLDNVQCRGAVGESGLLDCMTMAASGLCRDHTYDVGISCPGQALECEVGRVRLVGGVSENMGRIEVCNGSQWGTLCGNEDTTSPDPSDICKSLGFSGDNAILTGGGFFGKGTGPQFGSMKVTPAPSSCDHEDDLGVICTSGSTNTCRDGAVRLGEKAGDSEAQRVEVCLGGTWSSICDDSWDKSDATVVCRQLGQPSDAAAAQRVGGGSGSILLTNVKCSGDEKHVLNCPQAEIGTASHCTHDNDAGVICTDDDGETAQRTDGGSSDNTAWIVVAVFLIILLIIVLVVAIVLGVLFWRHRKTAGKTIFTVRTQSDQVPFAESTSYPEGLSSAPEEMESMEKTEL